MTEQQKAIVAILSKHPALEKRIAEMIEIVDVKPGEYKTADEAEEFVIREVKQLGQELVQEWATGQQDTVAAEVIRHEGAIKHEKKTSLGIQLSEK